MTLVVLLRGINVGGHRRFRPRQLAEELRELDVVNIGAAGTFVVRRPGSQAQLRAALAARLPKGVEFVVCDARALLRLATTTEYAQPRPRSSLVPFVSFLAAGGRDHPAVPFTIPEGRRWYVRVTYVGDRLVIGEYRRHMKTIGYLGRLDRLFGTMVVTRSQSTVAAILQVLESEAATTSKHVSRRAKRTTPG